MRINNNLMAANTTRMLGINQGASSKSMEKLSSGYRINKAGDDAAGLAISEKMRGQIKGLNQASKNSEEAISLIQTAEGGLNESHAILQRMRELAVQASTGTMQDEDRAQINKEFSELKNEIGDISDKTQFNNMKLLDGNFGSKASATGDIKVGALGITAITLNGTKSSATGVTYTFTDAGAGGAITVDDGNKTVTLDTAGLTAPAAGKTATLDIKEFGISITVDDTFVAGSLDGDLIAIGNSSNIQTGANEGDVLGVSIADMSVSGLGLTNTVVSDADSASSAITEVNDAIKLVSDERAKLGATQNRLEYKIKNLDSSAENAQSAESKIRDVDMAKEMVEYTKNDILQQAAQAMLAKANQAPQGVLQLLR